jgi:hypothetical protein
MENDMRDDDTTPVPLPDDVVQPDPLLEEKPAGWLRIAFTGLAAALVVGLMLYGLNRPSEPQQTAAAPEAASQQTSGSGQGQPGNGSAPNAEAAPSTTGQGQGEQGQGKSPRADSAVSGKITAPSDKAAQPAK